MAPNQFNRPDFKAGGSVGARQRLALPLALEDGRPPKVFESALYIISGFLLAAFIWASISEIREVSIASGEIKPSGSVHPVQHLEGGIVSEILVSAGQTVRQGDTLLRMRPESSTSDLQQLTTRNATLRARAIRLRAELNSEAPKFGDLESSHPEIVADQLTQYHAGKQRTSTELVFLNTQIAHREAELAATEAEIAALKIQVEIANEQLQIQVKLAGKGYSSKKTYLETKAAYQRTEASYIGAQGQRAISRQALAQATAERDRTIALANNTIAEQFATVTAEIAELHDSLERHQDRHQRLAVRAPVSGIVKDVIPNGPGAVVRPGDLVVEVVPVNQALVAEVEIKPSDIGHIRLGHAAEVSITTFDANLFGKLTGNVSHISPSTFKREQDGEPYFKAVIALNGNTVGAADMTKPIQTGMIVQAEIITGKKSLARYMLKPIYRSLDSAFSER